ncbi:MAG: helicase HerA-like domain-containing protein, partial [Streptococcus sp.]
KAIKVAAQSFRPNPDFDTETVITELGTGEALVSFLNEKGQPSVVERAYILSPQSSFDLLNESEQLALITTSPFHQKYSKTIDRESDYEKLAAKASKEAQEEEKKEAEKERAATEKAEQKRSPGRPRKSSLEKAKDSFLSSLFRTIAREIAKLIMGSFKRK